ncbi:NAD(P)H-dependent oxidoreductase [Halobacteriovorax sp. GB3]|uniref:NADPH-dependent FMN reductase n=1 Tax=Halobacteriovorax sp. GB3 TaxID=2719615 RepID=UPI00235DD562|nr:NAD(P)H-dependent oxidoreductase [Halobacteriovorax sp. GB3]MDD0851910.1 NAD(P)H-dependent oxidoreductase [Halobacteriovorax sp. GB3]
MAKVSILCATSGNNLKLSHSLEEVLKELGAEVELINLEALDLPLYSPKEEGNGIPEKATHVADTLAASQGIVMVAPEYNGSLPPVMNNAVAWISRTGEDWRAAFNGKFSVVATHSGGGGSKVCNAMRQQLEHVGSVVLPRTIVTNYQKELNPKSAKAIMTQLLKYC